MSVIGARKLFQTISKTGLFYKNPRCSLHLARTCRKSSETELDKQLKAKIKSTGPITVAEYMKEVLTNPTAGYYMNKDVFGSKGDFTTSPEISQMFGELLGIWCVSEWMAYGKPTKLQLVELGPGRGTLMADMCRTFGHFEGLREALSIHLVEVSPSLTALQARALGCVDKPTPATREEEIAEGWHMRAQTSEKHGSLPVYWYKTLVHVPKGFSFFIAHEFLDALPVHKFQKKDGDWHEVFIDVDETEQGPHHLRMVLARQSTAAQRLLMQWLRSDETREHIELCAEGAAITQTLAQRIAAQGGAALIIDYGHNGEKTDTIRAFRDHALHPLLDSPGTADITADVDFAYLKQAVEKIVTTHGPIPQGEFLFNMGIRERFQALLERATAEQAESHASAFTMLCHPEQMGERFKVLCLLPRTDRTAPGDSSADQAQTDYVPAGFVSPYQET